MFSRICTGLNAIRDMIEKGSFDEEALYRTSWLGYGSSPMCPPELQCV